MSEHKIVVEVTHVMCDRGMSSDEHEVRIKIDTLSFSLEKYFGPGEEQKAKAIKVGRTAATIIGAEFEFKEG